MKKIKKKKWKIQKYTIHKIIEKKLRLKRKQQSKGKKINIGDTSNLTNKMLYVKKILEKEEGKTGSAFVNGDLSAGFKPYFREE